MSNKKTFPDSAAKSYSQALYELANEEKNLNEIENQTTALIELISQSEDFNLLIKDPTIFLFNSNTQPIGQSLL